MGTTMVTPSNSRADLLIVDGDVVTMNARREVLLGGALAISGDRICDVGAASQIRERFPGTPHVDASGCVVTPGLVNAHQHATGDPLARSCIPDDLAPGESLFRWSLPLHSAHTADDDELAATLTAVDSVRNGVTTVVEAGTVAHPERVAAGFAKVGIRATIGVWGWDYPGLPHSAPADEVMARLQAVLDQFPPGGHVTGWVTLVGHDLVSDELLVRAAELARSANRGMTMHLSPTGSDPQRYVARTGRRPIVHLQRLGILGPHLLLAHAVWIDDAEVEALLASGTAVAYCPWAYLRLAQGVCCAGRHLELVRRGGRVALGCDSVNASDHLDIIRAAALAVGLARDRAMDAGQGGAATALELATIGGAAAIGMADDIGSLEPGKRADIVIYDRSRWGWAPRGDVALELVWSGGGHAVRDVFVSGRRVVADGRCLTVDEQHLGEMANVASKALFARAGITLRPRWPHLAST